MDKKLNWVVSYPKSGNTWIRLVVITYKTGEPDIEEYSHLGDIGEQIWHNISPIPVHMIPKSIEPQLRPAAIFNLANMKQNENSTLPIKSHHGYYTHAGIDLWKGLWTDKVVVPVRDPRDVCCSLKNHMGYDSYKQTADYMANDKATMQRDTNNLHHFIGSWSLHVNSWLSSDLDVRVVRYEDMKTTPVKSFREILSHLMETEPDEEQLKEAVRKCDFDRLQAREEEEGFAEQGPNHDQFFRKGQAGGWTDELPPEVAKRIEDDHFDMMLELNYIEK